MKVSEQLYVFAGDPKNIPKGFRKVSEKLNARLNIEQWQEKFAVKIELGDKVRETNTGFRGICVAITTYQNGRRCIGIQAKEFNNGLPVDIYWADEVTVEVVKVQVRKNTTKVE